MEVLLDLCEFIVDCEHKTAPLDDEGQFYSIRTPNIGKGYLILGGANKVSASTYKFWTKRAIPQEDDLIMAREAPVGNVAIIEKGVQVCLGQRTVLIRPNKRKVSPRYLCYLLLSDAIQNQVEGKATGATVAHLNMSDIRSLDLPKLPDLPTQQRIAGILSAYDELIEVNNQRIRLLEDTARQLYKEWFVRLRFPGHEQTKFVKGLPEGWEVKKVADAFGILGGGTPSTKMSEFWDGDVNWFTPSDITAAKGMFLSASGDKITKKGYENSSAKLFPAYSVMMTSRATIGEVGINTLPATTNQGFITCLPNEQVPYQYLYFWVYFNKETFEMLASGSTFLEITKGTFKKIEFLVPSADTMAQYVNLSAPIFLQIETLQSQNTQLRQIRDRLLPRLISGKLSVGAVPSGAV